MQSTANRLYADAKDRYFASCGLNLDDCVYANR